MKAGEVHQLRVFVGARSMGNSTGVVGCAPGTGLEAMAEKACLLGYPDTAFVTGSESDVQVDSFSPYEELRFCTQTLLATEAVWRADGSLAPDEPLRVRTPAGTVEVTRHRDDPRHEDDPVAYVRLPEQTRAVRAPRSRPPLPDAVLAGSPLVIDTGRARTYCLLSDTDIESVGSVPPDAVRDFCVREGVSGLCLTARRPDGTARLRVFTLSQDGAEDVATGGAAGGIPDYWQRLGMAAPHEPVLVVHQGFGGRQTRGELRVRSLTGGGRAVGGRVVPVTRGVLFSPATHQASTSSP